LQYKLPRMATKKTVKKATKVIPLKKAAPKKKRVRNQNDGMREFAFMLYMQKVSQGEISERTGVSAQTISAWKKEDEWEAKRAAKTISMDQLIVKALGKINLMLDEEDFNADAFAKAVAQLKTLKQRNTVDDEIMCFMDFQNWLLERRSTEGIEETFLKKLIRLQDLFIQHRLGN